jgi:hypothetical protein
MRIALDTACIKPSRKRGVQWILAPNKERLLAEEADAWLAHKVMETHNPNSPDLTELATKAGAASHQLRLHVDTNELIY